MRVGCKRCGTVGLLIQFSVVNFSAVSITSTVYSEGALKDEAELNAVSTRLNQCALVSLPHN